MPSERTGNGFPLSALGCDPLEEGTKKTVNRRTRAYPTQVKEAHIEQDGLKSFLAVINRDAKEQGLVGSQA